MKRITLVGGGLAGSLVAVYLAKRHRCSKASGFGPTSTGPSNTNGR